MPTTKRHFDDLTSEEQDALTKYDWCKSCQSVEPCDEQYSFGVYAGILCENCARTKFRDQCGLGPEGQGSQNDLDEPYYEEET